MRQVEYISGFSELKDLLVRSYRINEERSNIRLHFTEARNELILHDYQDHRKAIVLSGNVTSKDIRFDVQGHARRLIEESLQSNSAAEFLNQQFLLNGFFRP